MIRYLENNEKQNIRPLYEHCFDDTKEYTDYYFQNRLPGNHVIVNERDNKIVNCVHLIPKTVILGKLKTNIIYMVLVLMKSIENRELCQKHLNIC